MVNRSTPPPLVLLVDDDVALRTALTFTLELDGFVVRSFASGEELLACDLPANSSCLVLDQHLPGMTGVETLAQLRARNVTAPALLITSHVNLAVRAAVAALDAVIVEKPLLNDSLKLAIDAAFERPASSPANPH